MFLDDVMSRAMNRRTLSWVIRLGAGLFGLAVSLVGDGTATTDPIEFFKSQVRPILAHNCWACHTSSQLGGLRLDSKEHLLQGGESGPAIVPGNPDASLLLRAIGYSDERLKMPPTGKLRDEEISVLRTWIDQGAHWPDDSSLSPATKDGELVIRPEQRAFWSFQPLQEIVVPGVTNKSWPNSPIDHYVLSVLEARGLEPVAPASKRVLMRRASYDLTGLPPTPQAMEEFLKDHSPGAFAKVVDRLLASSHFGERWGRHWLDVARYGEDDVRAGGKRGYSNAWRYRDWVIAAFNQDMSYDMFVKAQIAGDLLEDEDSHELKAALGFFALGPWPYDNSEWEVQRANERDVRIDGLGRAFLGLTVACARCHDHKQDPIWATDYYALGGVFASTEYQEYPLVPQPAVDEYKEQQETIKKLEKAKREFLNTSRQQVAEILTHRISHYMVAAWDVLGPSQCELAVAARKEQLDEQTLGKWVTYLGKGTWEHPHLEAWSGLIASGATEPQIRKVADDFQTLVVGITEEAKRVEEENRRILSQAPAKSTKIIGPNGYTGYQCPECPFGGVSLAPDRSLLWKDLFMPFGEKGILHYDDDDLERFLHPEWKEHVARLGAEIKVLKAQSEPYPFLMGLAESGERTNLRVNLRGNALQLGEEVPRRFLTILSDGEPLPFIQGSGRMELAEAILAHPLAARVMANRVWQHLLGEGIVRTPSNLGQLGDRPSHPDLLDYLASHLKASNWSVKALIREIMLSSTYQLSSVHSPRNHAEDPSNRLFWRANQRRMDVESLRDSLLFVSGSLDLQTGGPSVELSGDSNRRTVYGKVSRYQLDGTLALFDFPDPSHSSEKRNITNIPLQALFFLNSDLVMIQSEALAKRLESDRGSDDVAKIRWAHRLLYGREATRTDVEVGLAYLAQLRKGSPESPSAWPRYAQVLLASLEFSYVD